MGDGAAAANEDGVKGPSKIQVNIKEFKVVDKLHGGSIDKRFMIS